MRTIPRSAQREVGIDTENGMKRCASSDEQEGKLKRGRKEMEISITGMDALLKKLGSEMASEEVAKIMEEAEV